MNNNWIKLGLTEEEQTFYFINSTDWCLVKQLTALESAQQQYPSKYRWKLMLRVVKQMRQRRGDIRLKPKPRTPRRALLQ